MSAKRKRSAPPEKIKDITPEEAQQAYLELTQHDGVPLTPAERERMGEYQRRLDGSLEMGDHAGPYVELLLDKEVLHVQLDEALARVPAGGRKEGATNKRTDAVRAYIRELLTGHKKKHPHKKPSLPALYEKAKNDHPEIIVGVKGEVMPQKTFCDHARAVLKEK